MKQTIMQPIAQMAGAQKKYRILFDQVRRTGQPLFLLKQNKPDVVVLEPMFFQEIMRKADLYEEALALVKIKRGQQEYRLGQTRVLKSIVSLMEENEN